MKWSILEIYASGDLITSVRYHCRCFNDVDEVETEGNWFFAEPTINIPLEDVTEEMIVEWISKEATKDGVNLIESRLEEQLASLSKTRTVHPPWKPKVFTLTV
jgi:peptide subunit release factor 1 (eRF1)